MANLKPGLLYISLHNQLKKKVGVNNYISKKGFFEILGRHFLIPKNIRVIIIKEMENRCLVKVIDPNTVQILSCEIDLENDVNKLYERAGLY